MWPGFGDNSRVLKWICERLEGKGKAVETPIGNMPTLDAIDTSGLDIAAADMEELLRCDNESWLAEVESVKGNYTSYGAKLPKVLAEQLEALEKRLS